MYIESNEEEKHTNEEEFYVSSKTSLLLPYSCIMMSNIRLEIRNLLFTCICVHCRESGRKRRTRNNI